MVAAALLHHKKQNEPNIRILNVLKFYERHLLFMGND